MQEQSKIFKKLFIIISFLIPAIVAVLLLMPKNANDEMQPWLYSLPFYNAIINTLTAILLVLGYYFVKNAKVQYHRASMISAFLLGCVFLIIYVIYHSSAPSTKFGGEGAVRYVYFFFLLSHVLLAFIVVPLVLSAVYFAISDKVERHKKIVKFTFPVWLYVSVSGVIVYLMISPYYPG
jgi:putative membrane protein